MLQPVNLRKQVLIEIWSNYIGVRLYI